MTLRSFSGPILDLFVCYDCALNNPTTAAVKRYVTDGCAALPSNNKMPLMAKDEAEDQD